MIIPVIVLGGAVDSNAAQYGIESDDLNQSFLPKAFVHAIASCAANPAGFNGQKGFTTIVRNVQGQWTLTLAANINAADAKIFAQARGATYGDMKVDLTSPNTIDVAALDITGPTVDADFDIIVLDMSKL